jgi:hypothetical protein
VHEHCHKHHLQGLLLLLLLLLLPMVQPTDENTGMLRQACCWRSTLDWECPVG